MSRALGLRARAALAILSFGGGFLGWGCDGGGGSGVVIIPPPPPIVASFAPSATPVAANLVRLRGGSAAADTVVVEVAIGGPTTSSDINAFAFDIAIGNPSVAAFADNSEVAGNALVPTGGQGLVFFAEQPASPGDRVVVGIAKSGGGSGNGVGAGETVVIRLTFKLKKRGTSFLRLEGEPGGPGPTAEDSAGAPIPSIVFDSALATLTGS